MAERTTWSQKHTTDCRSVHCPCYRDGLDDHAVAAGPPAVQAGAEIADLRAEVESLRTQLAATKADHAEMVARNRLLRDRPDLPMDRLVAYDAFMADLAAVRTDLSEARAEIERLRLVGE